MCTGRLNVPHFQTSPISYRYVVLIKEVGKLFTRSSFNSLSCRFTVLFKTLHRPYPLYRERTRQVLRSARYLAYVSTRAFLLNREDGSRSFAEPLIASVVTQWSAYACDEANMYMLETKLTITKVHQINKQIIDTKANVLPRVSGRRKKSPRRKL